MKSKNANKAMAVEDKYRYIVKNSEIPVTELSKITGFNVNYIYNILSKARMFGLHVRKKKKGLLKAIFEEIKNNDE